MTAEKPGSVPSPRGRECWALRVRKVKASYHVLGVIALSGRGLKEKTAGEINPNLAVQKVGFWLWLKRPI
jgi:hypothetical protein